MLWPSLFSVGTSDREIYMRLKSQRNLVESKKMTHANVLALQGSRQLKAWGQYNSIPLVKFLLSCVKFIDSFFFPHWKTLNLYWSREVGMCPNITPCESFTFRRGKSSYNCLNCNHIVKYTRKQLGLLRHKIPVISLFYLLLWDNIRSSFFLKDRK